MHKWASRCVQGRGIIVVRPKDLEQIRGNTQKFIAYVGNMMSRISSSSAAAASASASSASATNAAGGQLNNGAGDLSNQVQQLQQQQQQQQQQLQQQANGGQLTGSSVASGAPAPATFDPTSFNPPPRLRPEDLRPPPQKRARNTSVGSSPANAGSPSDARTPRTPANVGSPLIIESPAGMTTTRMEDPDRPRPPNQRKRKSSGSQLEGVPEEQLPTAASASAFGLGGFQGQQGSAAGASSLGLQVGNERSNEIARAPDDPLAFLEAQWSKLQSIDSSPAALGPVQADLGFGGMQLASPAPDPKSVFVSTSSFYNSSNGGGVAPAVLKSEPAPPAAEEAFDISWFISDECYDDAAVTNPVDEPAATDGASSSGGAGGGGGNSSGSNSGAKGGSDGRAIEAQTPDLLHSTGVEESPASTREALSPSTAGSGQRGTQQQQQQTPSSLSRLSIPQSGSTSSAAKTPVVPLEPPVDQLFDMGPDSYFGTFDSEGLGESWII